MPVSQVFSAAVSHAIGPPSTRNINPEATIDANLEKLRLKGSVVRQDATRALAQERRIYDLILCDPPYDSTDHDRIAPHLARLLAPNGLLVYESSGRDDPPDVPGLDVRTSRKYGSARLTLFEH